MTQRGTTWVRCHGCQRMHHCAALNMTGRAWSKAPRCRPCDAKAFAAWERRQATFHNPPRVQFETVSNEKED